MIERELKGMCGFSDLEQRHVAWPPDMQRQAAFNAVMKKTRQPRNWKTIRPRASKDPTLLQEKQKALAHLMLFKEKRCGTIKAQRLHKTKEETSSPTVQTEQPSLLCVIEAKEQRQVRMTCNHVPAAFMQVLDVDEEVVHVRPVGPFAEPLTEVDPNVMCPTHDNREWKARAVSEASKGPARHVIRCHAFLERPVWTPAQRGLPGQSV
jgi:hypothetical protein